MFIDELKKAGYPVYRQGSILPDEPYPDDFLTFWHRESEEVFFSDKAIFEWQNHTVCFYSSDFEHARGKIKAVREQLQKIGCICSPVIDTVSGRDSHIGYAFYCIYREENV